jgi:hypothetical protein
MFSSLRLVRGPVEREIAQASRITRALRTLLEPTLPGVWNGGDWIWRADYRDEADYRAAESALAGLGWLKDAEHVAFSPGDGGGASPARGVYRVALFCANRDPSLDRLARFRAETCAMPRHVRSIRRWQLSTPVHASGSRRWTHVWEQEYDDLAGLSGPYMMHPCHWSQVDRWFDPEDPDWLIDPRLCHSFCATTAPVIA